MEVDLDVTEEMNETVLSLTIDQFFTRVSKFMENTGAVETELTITGEVYECVLHFKERKEQK